MFGLRVGSNRPLPGIKASLRNVRDFDVHLHFDVSPAGIDEQFDCAEEPFFASSIVTESGEPVQRIWKTKNGGLLRFDYADDTQFWMDAKGREVWSRWGEKSTFEDAASYVMGPILGYLLRLRGVVCLHASAVRCGGRAAAFVGPGGAGKSTLAAALALRGHDALSDDVVALTERNVEFYVAPSYPYLSLWPESVRAVYGAERDFDAFSQNFTKRLIPTAMSELRFAEAPVELDSIFLLEERANDEIAPSVESVDMREAMIWLVANTYANLLLDERLRAQEFALLGRLLARVRVRRVRAHEDASRIGRLCDLIEGELRAGSNAAPAGSARRRGAA